MSRNSSLRRSMLEELLEGQPARKKQRISITAPVSTLLLDGQRALEDKRYNDAILSFSNAIGNSIDRKADLLHLYDLRAITYAKLGDIDNALKDAKKMIRLDRADHRGYLKCAQVERSRGRLKEAIRICEYGSNSVGQHNEARQSLEMYLLRLREVQKGQIIYEKNTDPMEVLPPELLELVLTYINYREAIAIMRVCKAWHSRLRATDLVTQSVDTESTRKTLKHEHVKTAFNRLGRNPRKLYLSRLNENAAYFVSTQLKSWLRLESIRSLAIDDAKIVIPALRYEKFANLRELFLKQVSFRIRNINDVLQRCPALEHATFVCNFVNTNQDSQENNLQPVESGKLRSLKIGQEAILGQATHVLQFNLRLDDTKPIAADLEHLELEYAVIGTDLDLSAHTRLTTLALRECVFADLKTPPTIENFQWADSFMSIPAHAQEKETPAGNMRTLDLRGKYSIKRLTSLIQQGLSKTHLRRLSLSNFVSLNLVGGHVISYDLDFLTTVPDKEELSNVEHLILRDDNIRDGNQATIFAIFPNVKHLELESYTITEQIITDHIKSKDSVLKSVLFRNCPNVSHDIDKWAYARKVDVRHVRQSSVSSGGRRIRYE